MALAAPPPADLALLVVALLAVSTSGPLITATAAPALAIAFWRNAMASAVVVPLAAGRARTELAALSGRQRGLAVLAGIFLAAHFATWVPSLRYTSVASATALVAAQPVWAALFARLQGQHIPTRAWAGIALAVTGVAVLTGVDVSFTGRALTGDLLALAGGVFSAAYVTTGGHLRQSMTTTAYTAVCYSTAAGLLLLGCLVGNQALAGYPAASWWKLAALTAGAQLVGHSSFNRILSTTSPTVVSLAILLEVPGATLIAAVVLHQRLHLAVLPAAALLLAGIATVVRSGSRAVPVE